MSFIEYLALRRHEGSPVGDLARDVAGAGELDLGYSPGDVLYVPRVLREPRDVLDLVRQLAPHGPEVAEAAVEAWSGYRRYLARRAESAVAGAA